MATTTTISNYADAVIIDKSAQLESMSARDLLVLASKVLTIASRKPGIVSTAQLQTDITTAIG